MITRDLLRFKTDATGIEPRLLKPTPAVVALAEQLLAHWRGGIGRMRGELEDAEQSILHGSRQMLVGRGLSKVIVDDCTFAEPDDLSALRATAFAASARLLAAPAAEVAAHVAAVAAVIGRPAEGLAEALYADLPDRAVLRAAPAWDAQQLIGTYNLALVQGLLLGASELRIQVRDRERGLHRRLIRALRRRRLCAEVSSADGGGLYLAVSGPGAVLDQRTAYGMQLALFLPALCCARDWEGEADVAPPRAAPGAPPLRMRLGHALGLPGDLALLDFVPPELRDWLAQLAAKLPGWTAVDPEPLLLPGGGIILPDLALDDGRGPVSIELFHRWHLRGLRERLDQLASGALPGLLIGVDRSLQRLAEARPLLDHPLLAQRGFLFSDLPSPRALTDALARIRSPQTPTPPV